MAEKRAEAGKNGGRLAGSQIYVQRIEYKITIPSALYTVCCRRQAKTFEKALLMLLLADGNPASQLEPK